MVKENQVLILLVQRQVVKAGISFGIDSSPGYMCDIGVREKVTIFQATNDPVFVPSK